MRTLLLVVLANLVAVAVLSRASADPPVRETRTLQVVIADGHVEELARLVFRRGGTLSDVDAQLPIDLPEAEKIETVALLPSASRVLTSVESLLSMVAQPGEAPPRLLSVDIRSNEARLSIRASEGVARKLEPRLDAHLRARRATLSEPEMQATDTGTEAHLRLDLMPGETTERRINPDRQIRGVERAGARAMLGVRPLGDTREEPVDDTPLIVIRRDFEVDGVTNWLQLHVLIFNVEVRGTYLVTGIAFRLVDGGAGQPTQVTDVRIEVSAVVRPEVEEPTDD